MDTANTERISENVNTENTENTDKIADDPETGNSTDTAAAEPEKKKQHSPMNPIQIFLLNLLVVIVSFWLMFGFILGFSVAPNGDMVPSIHERDLLLYYRLGNQIRVQDVVVIRKNNINYVGRIIAAENDTVDITDDNKPSVNGNSLVESNIYYETPRYEGFVEYPVTLGKDEYFVLTDMRSGGEDSRYYGIVKKSEIKGTVITVIRRTSI